METINYDLRPIDTENVINTRNRVRLSSVMIVFGVLLYLSIRTLLVQPQASWIHLLHFVVQPLVMFVTIIDVTNYVYVLLIAGIIATAADSAVLILNFIATNRCLGEPTASCFERLYENAILLCLAVWFVLFDVLQVTQMYELLTQLRQKDHIEKANREMIKYDKKVPTWTSRKVFSHKIRTMNVFLITFDITLATLIPSVPLLAVVSLHTFVDLFVYFSINEHTSKLMFDIMRVVYMVTSIGNFVVVILLLQTTVMNVGRILGIILTTILLTTDLVQIMYTSIVIETLTNYESFKIKMGE